MITKDIYMDNHHLLGNHDKYLNMHLLTITPPRNGGNSIPQSYTAPAMYEAVLSFENWYFVLMNLLQNTRSKLFFDLTLGTIYSVGYYYLLLESKDLKFI